MNARNEIKKLFNRWPDARRVLGAVQLRFAARVDLLVARWLARCAADIEAAQCVFVADRKPGCEFGLGASLVAPSPRWDELA